MADNPLLATLDRSFFRIPEAQKFEAKLSEEERCAVLALVKSRVQPQLVAAAFGVDRRTVSHIANSTSPHYKKIRRLYVEMGHDDFVAAYLTPEVVERMKQVKPPADDAPTSVGASNARAKGKAGFHTMKPDQCGYPHRVEIAWRDDGWYYRDLDGDNVWLHNGDDSKTTSQACYTAVYANLTDN